MTVRYDIALPEDAALELIQVVAVGCDEIDLGLIPPRATLCNVHVHHAAVPDFVILHMLEWQHRAAQAVESVRRGS